jgi:endonuclease YncB( thermonuclease family)
MQLRRLPVLLCALLLFALPAAAQEPGQTITGKVVAVKDGDTINVLHGGRAVTVRLHGIDAPEMGQPFGNNAKQAASRYAFGKVARIRITDVDRYGRAVGRVTVDGGSLNQMLVRDGLAWWYRRYAPREGRLESLERAARNANQGLWSRRTRRRRGIGDPRSAADGSRSRTETARTLTRSPKRSGSSSGSAPAIRTAWMAMATGWHVRACRAAGFKQSVLTAGEGTVPRRPAPRRSHRPALDNCPPC